ncbi:MAG: hypothetical protein ABJI65_18015, partial [Tateyamaria sp.]|uniref:hypothetical protein n=1 Tax=Tateyamaria sp. TaxID=1929288 RepID=UPI00329E2FCB
MNIVLITHPDWLDSRSMPRFAEMICDGMRSRGHAASTLTAPAVVSRLPSPTPGVRKWLRYFDQFALFPRRIASKLNAY